jgi:hypothetical protein
LNSLKPNRQTKKARGGGEFRSWDFMTTILTRVMASLKKIEFFFRLGYIYSQKAILKIRSAKITIFFDIFNSHNSTNF